MAAEAGTAVAGSIEVPVGLEPQPVLATAIAASASASGVASRDARDCVGGGAQILRVARLLGLTVDSTGIAGDRSG